MKISFLINNIYGIGGTNRTVINLAEALSADHEVEIVSVFRRTNAAPRFEISPQVTVRPLVDLRPGPAGADRGDPLLGTPTAVVPRQEEFHGQYSELSDRRIIEYLTKTNADVVVGTRPSLNLFVARYTRDSALRVAQEHMTHLAVPPAVRAEMARVYPRLDAVTTVTDADARSFLEHTPVPPDLPVVAIPNSVPEPEVRPATDEDRKIIVAAGRMHRVKRYDLLLRAFAQLAGDFPDWHLRIYGDGGEAGRLRTLVHDLGVAGQVLLMGGFSPIESEWAKGSIAAVTSSAESFGMTLVEAMRCGLPVVSTDCPVGPREIVRHGEDGLLVTNGDADAVAAGLRALMADPGLRRRMAHAALRNSARYDPAVIAARYVELFEDAARRRTATAGRGYRAPSAKPLGRAPGTSAAPATVRDAVCHVTAVGHARLALRLDGPTDGRHRWSFLLREQAPAAKRRPDLPLATERTARDNGGTRCTAEIGPEALTHLGDGRWKVLVRSAKGELVHVRAGIRDTRALLDVRARMLADGTDGGPVLWNLPYALPGGKLMLRTIHRASHAEVRAVRVGDDTIDVSAVLMGALRTAPGARLVLTRRGHHRAELSVPAEIRPGGEFHARLPLQQAVESRLERWEDWDWWVEPDPRLRRRVRVCHLFEDFPDVKSAFAYPAVPVKELEDPRFVQIYPSRPVRVRPYCSVSGAMAMNVVDR
ncbi:glycosyltransferase family 4 protein [Streptomyces antimicrobicus]|uniref:D-inositol 3-phosphate glycosyltransferase n=1 Tax=Streptomyces antimicrobicus TaxID=2883108 RepID=A0ABS8B068_9ACTN|nr:glycosyltransferase family 4 protein [Streptomyces antimicrobicus]MCB5177998.1 glycosyltransferase family 4 protein [Streptomyces antimicrobicus]